MKSNSDSVQLFLGHLAVSKYFNPSLLTELLIQNKYLQLKVNISLDEHDNVNLLFHLISLVTQVLSYSSLLSLHAAD